MVQIFIFIEIIFERSEILAISQLPIFSSGILKCEPVGTFFRESGLPKSKHSTQRYNSILHCRIGEKKSYLEMSHKVRHRAVLYMVLSLLQFINRWLEGNGRPCSEQGQQVGWQILSHRVTRCCCCCCDQMRGRVRDQPH